MRLSALLLLSSSVLGSHIKRQHNHNSTPVRLPPKEDLAVRHARHVERIWAALADAELERRQADPAAFPTNQPGYEVYPIESITPLTGDPTTNTVPLPTNAAAGQSVPIPGAPALPAFTLNTADWPAGGATPDPNSAKVKEWMKELDGYDIPDYSKTVLSTNPDVSTCAASVNPNVDATANGRCWWTCGGCLRWTDVSVCNDTLTAGLTFDDGPGYYTPKLLSYLKSVDVKATFYLVGTAALYRPDTVRSEYVLGHELAVHTWSHSPLTTLTNAEIVAELGWTREIIKAATGVTPLQMRPPYGDIDDRVRAISLALGLRPVIWTRQDRPDLPDGELVFDTNDFRVHANQTTAVNAHAIVGNLLDIASAPNFTTGTLWLEHDLFKETVDLAISVFIPQFRSHNPPFNLMPVTQCLKRPLTDGYVETNTDQSNPAVNPPLGPGDGGSDGTNTGTATGTGSKPTGSKATTTGGANPTGAGQGGAASPRMVMNVWAVLLAGVGAALAL